MNLEKRLLQASVILGGLVPVGAGIAGAVAGLGHVGGLHAATDSHFRYLSGLLVAIGIGFWSTVPDIETKGARFRMLAAIVVVGGLVRLATAVGSEQQPITVVLALGMELVVTPLLAIWQARVTDGCRTSLRLA